MKIMGLKDTINWYDNNAKTYSANASRISFDERVTYFLSKMSTHPKILDAGCGDGRDAETLSKNGAQVTGIDLSQGLISVAEKRNLPVEFVHGSFLHMPFLDGSFDGVWSNASLVHLETVEDVQKALNEFARVLKPRGSLYVLVKEQTGQEETSVVSDSLSNHDRFFRYYTIDGLSELLTEAGFVIDEIEKEDDLHGRKEVRWLRMFARKA